MGSLLQRCAVFVFPRLWHHLSGEARRDRREELERPADWNIGEMKAIVLFFAVTLAAQTLAPDQFTYPPQTGIKPLFMVGDTGDLCMSYSAKGVLTVYTGCQIGLRPISRVVVKALRPDRSGQ